MSKPHFNDERNTLAQIGALGSMVRGNANAEKYLSPQEKRMYTVMSDLMQSKHLNGFNTQGVSPAIAKEVFTKMATRTYRVQIAGSGRVNVSSWGLATDVQDSYDCVDALPHWMQRKIAVLMIFDPEKVNEEIKGVGRRISKGTFWLYPEEGEDDGDDARAPRKDAGA